MLVFEQPVLLQNLFDDIGPALIGERSRVAAHAQPPHLGTDDDRVDVLVALDLVVIGLVKLEDGAVEARGFELPGDGAAEIQGRGLSDERLHVLLGKILVGYGTLSGDEKAKEGDAQDPDDDDFSQKRLSWAEQDDDADEELTDDPDEDCDWPDARLAKAWWDDHRGRYQSGQRYLAGKEADEHGLDFVLREGRQNQRYMAAFLLGRLAPQRPLFEVRAKSSNQREKLEP